MRTSRTATVGLAALALLAPLAFHAQNTVAAPPSSPPAAAAPGADASTNLLLPEETPLHVRIDKAIDTEHTRAGELVTFTLADDVKAGGAVAIPRGAVLHGEVVEARKSGAVSGRPELVLKLRALDLGGTVYKLYAYEFRMQGVGHGPTVTSTTGSSAPAPQLGSAWGTSPSGTAASDSRSDRSAGGSVSFGAAPPLVVPAQAQLDFYLASPVAVQPVSAEQAAVLARRVPPGPATVYLRGEH